MDNEIMECGTVESRAFDPYDMIDREYVLLPIFVLDFH